MTPDLADAAAVVAKGWALAAGFFGAFLAVVLYGWRKPRG
jgi:hypothetical protein